MHETSENFSFGSDFQGVAAHGRLDSRRLDRHPMARLLLLFVGMEIDHRQPPVRSEPSGRGGLDWKANRQGLDSIYDVARSGRPTRLDRVAQDKLEKALAKSPEEFGLQRSRWDGVVVVEFLRKESMLNSNPVSTNWLKRLGFILKRPVYRYIQASNKGVARFRRGLQKTSPNPRAGRESFACLCR